MRLRTERLLVEEGDGYLPSHEEVELPVVELAFRYGDVVLHSRRNPAFPDEEGEEPLDELTPTPPPPWPLARNRTAENEARRILEGFGAVEIDCLQGCEPTFGSTADYVIRLDGDVHGCCAFSAQALPQLRKLGWEIDVAEDYPFRVLEGDSPWYVDVDPDDERPNWFNLELGVVVEGRRVTLLPALIALLERMPKHGQLDELLDASPARFALPVGDAVYLSVPTERLRRLLRVLLELYDPSLAPPAVKPRKGYRPCVHHGRLRLHRLQATALGGIEESLADGDTPTEWRDQAHLTQLGQALLDCAAKPKGKQSVPEGLQAELRPYQQQGVAWLGHLASLGFGAILADDMGLGKTLQTIAHVLAERESGRLDKPALIVAPTSVVRNWQREIYRFAPSLRPLVLLGAKRRKRLWHIDSSAVVLTSYPLLLRDRERYADHPFGLLVLDEAQTIKNRTSQIHRAVKALDADRCVALSGTPLENHLGELHALFDVAVPGLLGDERYFHQSFRRPIEAGDDERLGQLRRRVAPFMMRRLKSDVATELPPKTEMVRAIELSDDQRELYESIRIAAHADVRKLIRQKGLAASTVPVLDALMKLRQVCCDPRLVRVSAARQVRSSAKYEQLLELVEELSARGRRILVFSQFTTMLGLIADGLDDRGISYGTLTGASTDRQEQIDAFQQGRTAVFLISLKAGGTGLTLTEADTVIHYDPWWNSAAQEQATDRAYRIGQKKPVFVYKLIVAGSVEERMLQLQTKKRHLADAIMGAASLGTLLDVAEVDDLFAPLEG
ncbi:MAG: DEAD/DEAH box helicase [Deltaproteobacteria bacterium]|nr:DEAD/DEAH box helicase [Deltaproteobacteria bacterium]MBW2532237.1 DEAD/DEAH box helicase [Deltaproteobacteria bacterium]